MKRIIQLTFAVTLLIAGYSVQSLKAQTPAIDERLVGIWSGSEKDQQAEGLETRWVQHRYKTGKKITYFTYIYQGRESHSVNKGKWWTKDGLFYETTPRGKKPDIFTYEVIDRNHVLFKAVKVSEDLANQSYQFIDTRVEKENNLSK